MTLKITSLNINLQRKQGLLPLFFHFWRKKTDFLNENLIFGVCCGTLHFPLLPSIFLHFPLLFATILQPFYPFPNPISLQKATPISDPVSPTSAVLSTDEATGDFPYVYATEAEPTPLYYTFYLYELRLSTLLLIYDFTYTILLIRLPLPSTPSLSTYPFSSPLYIYVASCVESFVLCRLRRSCIDTGYLYILYTYKLIGRLNIYVLRLVPGLRRRCALPGPARSWRQIDWGN